MRPGVSPWPSTGIQGTLALPNDVAEHMVWEDLGGRRRAFTGMLLDLSAITQTGVVRLYVKIDGANYRVVHHQHYNAADVDDSICYDVGFATAQDVKVTYQSDTAEGAVRNIPYEVVIGKME